MDGFWFGAEPQRDDGFFESFYDQRARESLPGWRYRDAAPIAAVFEQAGFTRLALWSLEEIHRTAAQSWICVRCLLVRLPMAARPDTRNRAGI